MSKAAETVSAYRSRAISLLNQAAKELHVIRITPEMFIEWFINGHDRWSSNTIRQYRAAIHQLLEDAKCSGHLSLERAEQLIARVAGCISADGRQISPRPSRNSGRRKKPKSIVPATADRLLNSLKASRKAERRLAGYLLEAGFIIGPRNCEWPSVEWNGSLIQIRNAKNTNNRGNGSAREFEIAGLDPEELNKLTFALDEISRLSQTIAASWNLIVRRAQYAVRAACQDLKINNYPTLYTSRHIAISRWKCTKSQEEVAALAGHASTRTAAMHYGRRRSGKKWPSIVLTPNPQVVVSIRNRPKNKPYNASSGSLWPTR